MRRRVKLLSIIIILCIFCFSETFSVHSQLSVGDVSTYKITNSKIYLASGSNFVSAKGFRFKGTNYPSKTKVDFSVNYVGGGINGNFTIGNESFFIGYLENWYTTLVPFFMRYTSIIVYRSVYLWSMHNFTNGLYFNIYPYINPTAENHEFFENLGEDFLSAFESVSQDYPGLEYNYRYSEKNNIVYFESWLGGEISGVYGPAIGYSFDYLAEVEFGNNFHIAFDKVSGLVTGFGFRGWTMGVLNDQAVKVSLEYQYQLVGYRLPRYTLGTYKDYLSSIGLIVSSVLIPTIIIAVSIPVIVKYRKKKKQKAD
ncbi:MAG: hypothetical protein GNW80_12675 [Asgard group archaeon]|nr:hypothetical protein [Asgard group archaeon]